MLIKILIGVVAVIVVLVIVIALQPSTFRVTRRAMIDAPPSAVFEQVDVLRNWEAWNPFLKLDPDTKTTYEGPSSGTGAISRWVGNRNVGEGSMTIVDSRPDDLVRFKLEFLKPMAATNDVEFTFKPDGDQTAVTWSMTGRKNFVAKAMHLVMNMDTMVGGQFEKGLADMKSIVEAAPAK